MTIRINDQTVEVHVIAEDGSDVGSELTVEETEVVCRADLMLRSERRFSRENPGAVLVRVDSHRSVTGHAHGRYYLQYDVMGGVPSEFWVQTGHAEMVDLLRGVVCVKVSEVAGAGGS